MSDLKLANVKAGNANSSKEMKIAPRGSTNCTITAGSQITNKKPVLLQTVRAIATKEGSSKTSTVCILFDSGSQRSYITDGLRRKLRLNVIKSETLHLNTFSDNIHQEIMSSFLFNFMRAIMMMNQRFPSLTFLLYVYPYQPVLILSIIHMSKSDWVSFSTTPKFKSLVHRIYGQYPLGSGIILTK